MQWDVVFLNTSHSPLLSRQEDRANNIDGFAAQFEAGRECRKDTPRDACSQTWPVPGVPQSKHSLSSEFRCLPLN